MATMVLLHAFHSLSPNALLIGGEGWGEGAEAAGKAFTPRLRARSF
jgi:hypothetical protein